eukprot:Rmarinus@m.18166
MLPDAQELTATAKAIVRTKPEVNANYDASIIVRAILALQCVFYVRSFWALKDTAMPYFRDPRSRAPTRKRWEADMDFSHLDDNTIEPHKDNQRELDAGVEYRKDELFRVGMIGCGMLGSALLDILLTTGGVKSTQLSVSTRRPQVAKRFIKRGIEVTFDNAYVARTSDVLLVTVSPAQLPSVCSAIRDNLRKDTLVLVTAAGVVPTRLGTMLKTTAAVTTCVNPITVSEYEEYEQLVKRQALIRAAMATPVLVQLAASELFHNEAYAFNAILAMEAALCGSGRLGKVAARKILFDTLLGVKMDEGTLASDSVTELISGISAKPMIELKSISFDQGDGDGKSVADSVNADVLHHGKYTLNLDAEVSANADLLLPDSSFTGTLPMRSRPPSHAMGARAGSPCSVVTVDTLGEPRDAASEAGDKGNAKLDDQGSRPGSQHSAAKSGGGADAGERETTPENESNTIQSAVAASMWQQFVKFASFDRSKSRLAEALRTTPTLPS